MQGMRQSKSPLTIERVASWWLREGKMRDHRAYLEEAPANSENYVSALRLELHGAQKEGGEVGIIVIFRALSGTARACLIDVRDLRGLAVLTGLA